MKIEEAFAKFLNQEVIIYTTGSASVSAGAIDCVLSEVGDGWVRITQGDEDEQNESIVNIRNIVRIREYPRKKNGKKKIIID